MTVLKTQTSSKPRLQNDTLGNVALVKLYASFDTMPLEEFRKLCVEIVLSGGGKQPMKDAIIASMHSPTASKKLCLTKAQNFILAGMGLGV